MSRQSVFIVSILVTILTLAFCGLAWAYEAIAVADGGTISGTVQFAGQAPQLELVEVIKDQETCGNTVPLEVLIVNPQNKGLKNTVVYLERTDKGKKPEEKEPTLDNTQCLFVPHVQAMPVGTTLGVKNSDSILHNTHAFLGTPTVFNLALPIQGQVIKRKMNKAGAVRVQCDAHVHMSAWIVTLEHPYFAVTDENGSFKLEHIPPGKYNVIAWHEPWELKGKDKGGRLLYEPEEGVRLVQEVTVPAKGEAGVTFEFQ
jgi:hypothetical protein